MAQLIRVINIVIIIDLGINIDATHMLYNLMKINFQM